MRKLRWIAAVVALCVAMPAAARATEGSTGEAPVAAEGAEAVTSVPVMFYDHFTGAAESGLLVNGSYQRKKTYAFESGWKFAISKTSVLWHRAGVIAWGTMTNGVYAQKGFASFAGAWTHVAASCDTVALYSQDTGEVKTATLNNGVPGPWSSTFTVRDAWTMTATCDTLLIHQQGAAAGLNVLGTLKAGRFVFKQEFQSPNYSSLGATSTSIAMFPYLQSNVRPALGRVSGGFFTPTRFVNTSVSTQTPVNLVGGGNTLVIYNVGQPGSAVIGRLANGVWQQVAPISISHNYRIAGAGK